MSKILLQPCSNKLSFLHFQDTVRQDVDLNSVSGYVNSATADKLREIYPSGKCKVWGVMANNSSKWEEVAVGDIALFARKKKIFTKGTVTFTLHSKELANALWGEDKNGKTWEYLYFLDEVTRLDISYQQLNGLIGYKPNANVQAFNVLSEEQSIRAMETLDLGSEIYIEDVSADEYKNIVSRLVNMEETDAEYSAVRRKEQNHLKKILFKEKKIAVCSICHKEYPVSIMVAAHIKKRAVASPEERTDYNIVMPVCKMGCDELFERGYISVCDGKVVGLNKKPSSRSLTEYISAIKDNVCSFYNEDRKEYFRWHHNHHSGTGG